MEELTNGEVGQPLEVDQMIYQERLRDSLAVIIVMDFLSFQGNMKNGFFIEAGSHDSETNSDTLHFEINHGWRGLLVEPHPIMFSVGQEKHRKATSIQTCLSTQKK